MYTLYIDTSCEYLCLGVAKDYKLLDSLQEIAIRKQSELTIPYLNEMLNRNSLSINDINEVCVTIGPGSFTGIRIGMCIAKVLASLNNIPLKAISALNAYAPDTKSIVMFDAKANRVYLGIYDKNVPQIEDCVCEISELDTYINKYHDYKFVGDTNLINKESQEITIIENMNRIAPHVKSVTNVDALVPVYLKER